MQCGQPVQATQRRVKNSNGYLHAGKCLEEYAATGMAAVATCGLCGLTGGRYHMLQLAPFRWLHIPQDTCLRADTHRCFDALLCD